MRRFLALCLLFFTLNLSAQDISPERLDAFSIRFKQLLKENSHSGFFCYASPKSRRIIGCDDANKIVNLGQSSNIMTNYIAYKLEKKAKFDRSEDIQNYAKIFKYKASRLTFSDLVASRASIASNLDEIYPKDAQEYEYFDFILQMNPRLLSGDDYEYSKLSNLGAIYALSYSQVKRENSLLAIFKDLIESELKPDIPSIKLEQGDSPLDLTFSLNVLDLAGYLAIEAENCSALNAFCEETEKFTNGWIFSELDLCPLAMVGGQGDSTYLIANFYEENIAVAIFIDNEDGAKVSQFPMLILQEFVKLLNE